MLFRTTTDSSTRLHAAIAALLVTLAVAATAVTAGSATRSGVDSTPALALSDTIQSWNPFGNGYDPGFVPGEVIVRFKPGTTNAEKAAFRRANGLRLKRPLSVSNAELMSVPTGSSVEDTATKLDRSDLLKYAEPNFTSHPMSAPDDPRYVDQWAMNNTGTIYGGNITSTADADIDASEAWNPSDMIGNVKIAVIDSGVDYLHEDLASNMWTNTGEIGDDGNGGDKETNGADDDGNGYDDDWRGVNIFTGGDPYDTYGHGTNVASSAAARGNNGIGVAGSIWRAQIIPIVTSLGPVSAISSDQQAEAIAYARNAGADIINISSGSNNNSQLHRDAIAESPGLLLVAAAGNDSSDLDGSSINNREEIYPCEYELSNVVCVAATDYNDQLASFSNFGGESVDLAAPGVNIEAANRGGGYASVSGTSFASPITAGAAALLKEVNPGASPEELKAALMAGVDTKSQLAGKVISGGRLNLRNALDLIEAPSGATRVSLNAGQLSVVADEGLTPNAIGIVQTGAGQFTVTESGANLLALSNCTSTGTHTADCSAPTTTAIRVSTYAGNDDITVDSTLGTELYGGSGDDDIVGGTGSDLIRGSSGADLIDGRGGVDTVDYSERSEDLTIDLDNDNDDGGPSEADNVMDTVENIRSGAGDDVIYASSAANAIDDGRGDDEVHGGGGGDKFVVGKGVDEYFGDAGVDEVSYAGREEGVRISLDNTANDGTTTEDSRLDNAIDVENATGGEGGDLIEGSAGANVLNGDEGDDSLVSTPGDDVYDGGAGIDTADYSQEAAAIYVNIDDAWGDGASTESDNVLKTVENVKTGYANDTIIGNELDNVVDAGEGGDSVSLGDGVDTIDYSRRGTRVKVTINDGQGNDGGESPAEGDNIASNVENVKTGAGDDEVVGNDSANEIRSGAGNDTISGGAGNDTLYPGTGTDSVHGGNDHDAVTYFDRSTGVSITLNDATANEGGAGENDFLATDLERFEGSPSGDTIVGSENADELAGLSGNDVVSGLGGDDIVEGDDTLQDYGVYCGGGGSGSDQVDGGPGNDLVFGGYGNDVVHGGDGGDVLFDAYRSSAQACPQGNSDHYADDLLGDAGFDTADYSNTGEWKNQPNAYSLDNTDNDGAKLSDGSSEGDNVYDDVERLTAGPGRDTLIGSDGADELLGGGGDDTLDGRLGSDLLDGGSGIDTASYASRAGTVFVTRDDATDNEGEAGEGDRIDASVEGVEGGTGDDVMTGSPADERFVGRGGNDTIDGGLGNDFIDGGNSALDTVTYASRVNPITIRLWVTGGSGEVGEADTLQDIHRVHGGSGNDTIVGSGTSDTLDGGLGDDQLDGGSGTTADVLIGSAGIDTVDYSARASKVTVKLDDYANDGATNEKDNVQSSVENVVGGSGGDVITGSPQGNTLDGGAGDDFLYGEGGVDVLNGQAGADQIVSVDSSVDDVNCGSEIDTASVDAADDVDPDCENLVSDPAMISVSGGVLTFTAGSSQANNLQVSKTSTLYTFVDTATLAASTGCNKQPSGIVECGTTGVASVSINLGDLNDTVSVPSTISGLTLDGGAGNDTINDAGSGATILGGDGDDTLNGGAGTDNLRGGLGADAINGDSGTDTATYSERTNGVTINADGEAFDGEVGEFDNVGDTTEHLIGGSGADMIVGSLLASSSVLTGNAGNDVITATITGTTVMNGNDGNDTFYGTDGVDVARGHEGDDAAYTGEGEDSLLGGNGSDTLEGQGGWDDIRGEGGDDTLRSRDGLGENVSCGDGTGDVAIADPIDTATNCETVLTGIDTSITAGPADPTGDSTPEWSFTADATVSGFECSVVPAGATASFASCTSPYASPILGDGDYDFAVRAIDEYGVPDPSPAVQPGITVDTTAPVVAVSQPVEGSVTGDDQPPIAFTVTDDHQSSGSTCVVDEGTAMESTFSCASGSDVASALTDGAHTLRVNHVDQAGNPGTDVTSFEVDATPPLVAVIEPADGGRTGDSTPQITFTVTDAHPATGESCSVDGGLAFACTSGDSLPALSNGTHTLTVAAVDGLGNQGATTVSFVVGYATIGVSGTIVTYDAVPGDTNQVSVAIAGSQFVFTDASAPLAAGNGCNKSPSANEVSCPTAGLTQLTVNTQDLDDSVLLDFSWAGNNLVDAGDGNDVIEGVGSRVTIYGRAGDDVLTGSIAADAIFGGDGNDTFNGGGGNDVLYGEIGSDTLNGGSGSDTLNGHAGDDALNGDADTDTLNGDDGNDQLNGGDGADTLNGNNDNDMLDGGLLNDTFNGHAGVDTADYSGRTSDLLITAYDGSANDGGLSDKQSGLGSSKDNVKSDVENVIGGSGNDTITGTSQANMIRGGGGDDSLTGGSGADSLYGESGDDDLRTVDGVADNTDCGDGSADELWSDPFDTGIGCESRFDAPNTVITGTPGSVVGTATPQFSFDSIPGGAAFSCTIDSGSSACTSPWTAPTLSEGGHTFLVRASVNGATDPTPPMFYFVIDLTAPTISLAMPEYVTDAIVVPDYYVDDANPGPVTDCLVDGAMSGEFQVPCDDLQSVSLNDGQHTLQVLHTDLAGNAGASEVATFVVDTTNPVVTLTDPVDGSAASDATPAFEFSISEANPGTTDCFVDEGEPSEQIYPCSSGDPVPVALADGLHTLTVWHADQAGLQGASATIIFSVDTQAPGVSLALSPSGPSNNTGPVTVSSVVDSGQSSGIASEVCRIDNGDNGSIDWTIGACPSGTPVSHLAEGLNRVTYEATDAAGNAASSSTTYVLDTTNPAVTITTPVDGSTTSDTTPPAQFTVTDANLGPVSNTNCQVTGATTVDWYQCASGADLPVLSSGSNTLSVRHVDAAGNAQTATSTFTVATLDPAMLDVQVLTASTSTHNLTTEGTQDWGHWGRSIASSWDHKASGGTQISNVTAVGSTTFTRVTSSVSPAANWSDGTPTASSSATATGINNTTSATGNGFQFSVSNVTNADPMTLKLYAGVTNCTGRLEMWWSSNPGNVTANTGVTSTSTISRLFQIQMRPPQANDTLNVRWTQNSNATGSKVRLYHASLSKLTYERASAPSSANLTTVGAPGATNIDWAHWGGAGTSLPANPLTPIARSGASYISNATNVGSGTISLATSTALPVTTAYTWSGGDLAPTAANAIRTGIANTNSSTRKGFSFTVPAASSNKRTLMLYVGAANTSTTSASPVKLELFWGTSTIPVLTDTIPSFANSTQNYVYSINLRHATAGTTLNVKWSSNSTSTSHRAILQSAVLLQN